MTEQELQEKRSEFASKLQFLKYEAGQLGLWRTMHFLDDPSKMCGYEIAGTPELFYKIEKQREAVLQRLKNT